MSRELTEVEADSLHTELKEAVATFFGGSCSHSSSFNGPYSKEDKLPSWSSGLKFTASNIHDVCGLNEENQA